MASSSWKDLPDECWELTFDRLYELHHSYLQSPSLSCKRFLSITNTLRTNLSILHANHISFSKLFNRFPRLNSIDLAQFIGGDLHRVIIDITTSNLNLESLDLSPPRFLSDPELPLEALKILGSCMKNLKVLICSGANKLRDFELVVIADSMPCLEDLDVSFPVNDFGSDPDLHARSPGEVGVTDSGIEVVSSKLKGLRKIDISGNEFLAYKSLVALSMNCIYLTDIVFLNCSVVTWEGMSDALSLEVSRSVEFVMWNSTHLSLLAVDGIAFGRLNDYSIRCAKNISALEIYNSEVPDGYLHLLAKSGIPLKSFTLSQCESFTFSGISSLLNKYRSLETLCLCGIDLLTDEKINDLSQCLSALVTIILDLCGNLTESTFFKLAKNCPLLDYISMEGTNLGGGGTDRAIVSVKNPRIKGLNLKNNPNLSNECLAKLGLVCPSLEMLLVSSCKGITERGISDFLKSGSKVRKLQIDECGGIKTIGNGLELPELVFLGASRSGIDDDGLAIIGNRCRRLLNLNLDGCLGVTTVGLKEILTNCQRLRTLSLIGCLNLSKEAVDWMAFSSPSLRNILLTDSSLPSESRVDLIFCHGFFFFIPEGGQWQIK
ncbi:hypothetical protein Vadar_012709 [Vaccinium darrowii]|uniref:Uncharacterized protein n=1 Tax=Vaccinium darrowii TaxID=229202 RepID=A0ACB7XH59_9ERIC|nr:hypothetical protein Vadar_012709 [Vaccinium darrowii]